MKRIMGLGIVVLLALVGAGFAVAAKRDRGTNPVAFTFTATSGTSAKTRTCTGADGTYVVTTAVYTGTAAGRYEGTTARLRLDTTVNTTKGFGVASGKLRLRSSRLEAKANVTGVVKGGTLSGVLVGHDVAGTDRGRLIANFSAALGDGTIALTAGGGSADNDAVVFGGKGCNGVKPILTGALGTISVLSTTSITVATSGGAVTCSMTAEQAARVARQFRLGDRVSIRCDAAAKLVKIDRRR